MTGQIVVRHRYNLVVVRPLQHAERAAFKFKQRKRAVCCKHRNLLLVYTDIHSGNLLIYGNFRNQLVKAWIPNPQIAHLRSSQKERNGFVCECWSGYNCLHWSVMNFNYFVNLSRKEVNNVKQAALARHKHLRSSLRFLFRFGVFHHFVGARGPSKHFAPCGVVEGYELTWQIVVLHFVEADVFFAAAHQTRRVSLIKGQVYQFNVA